MKFDFVTLFPEVFPPYLETGVLGRGQEGGLLEFKAHDLRKFGKGKHKVIDDTPYGGGAGMVMKVEPIDKALTSINSLPKKKTVVLAARGKQFTQAKALEYAKLDQLVLICGRYEGIDQRVADNLADEEISVGPYVLAGGELGALIVAEAVSRLVPGVLGNPESLLEESYSLIEDHQTKTNSGQAMRQIEYPQYTKPEDYNGWKVPEILLSGNHAEIMNWRKENGDEKPLLGSD